MVVVIAYASQTGTAEEVSLELELELRRRQVPVRRVSCAEINLNRLLRQRQSDVLVLFLVATTGDGQPPDSLVNLWSELLSSSLDPETFAQLKYSVFGFGDSKYGEQYNSMARKLDRRLSMLGATKVVERGLGDQQDQPLGYRLEYQQWRNIVLEHLKEVDYKGVAKDTQQPITPVSSASKFRVIACKSLVPTKGFGRQTFEIEFECSLHYSPGDIISIRPSNHPDVVQYFLQYFELTGEQILNHREAPNMHAKLLFTDYLNLSDTVPFSFWSSIRFCLSQPKSEEETMFNNKLIQLSTDYSEYKTYIKDNRRSLKEVLCDFPSFRLPLGYFIEHINLLRPRQYSIASAYDGKTLRLLIRLIEKQLTAYRTIRGILSEQLTRPNSIGRAKLGTLSAGKITYQPTSKYILVGIGTGVAPLLSIVRQRALEKPWKLPSVMLYFGNQTKEEIYFKEQLQELQNRGIIKFKAAISREQPKQHVQDLIRLDFEELRGFVQKSTCVYVCGTTHTFARSISAILFQDILQEPQKQWKKQGRLIQQFW